MRLSRPQRPDAPPAQEQSGAAVEPGSDAPAGKPESDDVLARLAAAEREAEELIEQRRRELEQAQSAEWERWTKEMESSVRAERERREQLEAALEQSESQRRDLERRVADSDRLVSDARAVTEKRLAQGRREMEEARAGL